MAQKEERREGGRPPAFVSRSTALSTASQPLLPYFHNTPSSFPFIQTQEWRRNPINRAAPPLPSPRGHRGRAFIPCCCSVPAGLCPRWSSSGKATYPPSQYPACLPLRRSHLSVVGLQRAVSFGGRRLAARGCFVLSVVVSSQ